MQYLFYVLSVVYLSLSKVPQVLALEGASTNDGVATPGANPPGRLTNPLESINSIPAFFQAILDIVMVLAIPLIVFFIIYAGFLYVVARGKPEQIAKAHNALLYALIGGVLILAANVLLDIVTGTVNEFTSP